MIIATVQVGNYEKRGAEYLAKLYGGVARYMPKGVEWRGVCITDDPGTAPDGVVALMPPPDLSGWWSKVSLFNLGKPFAGERVLYLDLDTIIVGDLTGFASYSGPLAALRDPFFPDRLNSSVMSWEAGSRDHIWTRYVAGGKPQFDPRGDQYWIESVQALYDRWQDVLPGQVVSFKADCWKQGGIPDDARILIHHGNPRPHQCQAPYIKALWNKDS